MSRSKKIFLVFALIFFLILLVLAYDISKRTMFPGANKKSDVEQTQDESESSDSPNRIEKNE